MTKKQVKKSFAATLKRVRAMTPDQVFQTMIEAGIYTKKGRPTKHYK